MKEGFDKEIDSLLRRRARVGAGAPAGGDGPRAAGGAAHLDADELSAFAEGALPAAARVAAAAHLADCDECRGAVVALARASGFEVAPERRAAAAAPATGVAPAAAASPAGWRAWVAALFAPRVLRYAAPALALCMVAVVSYVALRTRQGAERGAAQVARNERRQAGAANEAAGGVLTGGTGTANANSGMNTNTASVEQPPPDASRAPEAANATAQPSVGRGHGVADAPPPADVAADVAPPSPVAKAEAGTEAAPEAPKPASVEERAQAKAETKEKTARAAEPAEPVTAYDQTAQQRRSNQARLNDAQMPDDSRSRGAGNNQSGVAGGGAPGAAPAPRSEDRDSAATRSERAVRRGRSAMTAGESASDDEVVRIGETRAAAGHRFRREGGARVDVNYKPSMPSTGVRRGTEAYRALVADLPEVGRVAEQLGGEVVVVVRGRAYRIH